MFSGFLQDFVSNPEYPISSGSLGCDSLSDGLNLMSLPALKSIGQAFYRISFILGYVLNFVIIRQGLQVWVLTEVKSNFQDNVSKICLDTSHCGD